MKLSRVVCIGLLPLVLLACNAVYVDSPIGGDPVPLEVEEWEGTWLTSDGTFVLEVVDHEKGLLRIAWVENSFSDGDQKLETALFEFRDGGDWIFATLLELGSEERERAEELAEGEEFAEEDGQGYYWGVLRRNDEQILVLEPHLEKLRALVENEILPGRLEADDVFLGPLDAEHLALILSDEHGFLFDFDDFAVASRIVH